MTPSTPWSCACRSSAAMIDTLTVNRANMRKAANGGFINATDCADYLAKKGMPFREAYGIVGKLVGHCVDTGHSLETLPLEEYKKVSDILRGGRVRCPVPGDLRQRAARSTAAPPRRP